jgi:hypothetical protein
MRSALLSGSILAVLLLAAGPARAEDQLVEKVRKAIDDGKGFLLSQQREDNGSWENSVAGLNYPGGATSLALLALLTSGVPPTDAKVQKGLEYVRTLKPVTGSQTYVVALQTMVYAQAGLGKDRDRIQANVDWLVKAQQPGGWTYNDRGGRPDNSNSQYALLGLHAGIEAGATVDRRALEKVRAHMLGSQIGGGWRYQDDRRQDASLTMTTAGLCNLLITGMDLHVGKQKMLPGGEVVGCGEYDESKPIADALRWIGAAFPAEIRPESAATVLRPAPFYCLYGLERAGRLSGRRFFGGHDWYEVGCRYLVQVQRGDGRWDGAGQDHWPVVSTSFALLFLSKGRTPVLISKLAYGPPDYEGWDNKRSDVRHVTEFASRELFKRQPLAWQIFDVRSREADTQEARRRLAAELLSSPVVYFNGHDRAPSGKEEEILKEYLENGGFVLAEACCGRTEFRRDFEKLMGRIFPDCELKRLPDDHPIWTASGKFLVTPNKPFPLYGVQHGCKTVAVLSTRPLAYYWEANDFDKSEDGKTAFKLAANIIAYATGLEPPRPRLTQVDIPPDESRVRIRRGFLKVAQLRRDGNDWQPAPKAMRNLMAEVRKSGLDVTLDPTPVYLSSKRLLQHYFFYMHGRGAFEVRAQDVQHLRFRLKTGGLLLADACCGSSAFDASFRKFMDVLWAEEKLKLEPIPLSDVLYSRELNGTAITAVRCRRPRADGKGVDPEYRVLAPALEGIKYGDRWVVIYSRYDIGCALEHTKSADCLGHDFDSAVRLGRAVVLYHLAR